MTASFYLGIGILLLGAALMMAVRLRRPEFFRGQTLAGSTQALTDPTAEASLVAAVPRGAGPGARG